MIVPQTRLLIWFAALALPGALLGAVFPDWVWGVALLLGAFLMVTASDAVASLRLLDGFAVELPEIVRMAKDRESRLAVRVLNPSLKLRQIRLALSFPREIESVGEDLVLVLPAGSEWAQTEWTFRPRRRGRYTLDRAYLEIASRLGLWAMRGNVPVRCELRVYPNLFSERRDLAALFLNKGVFGIHARRQLGKGREFEKLREYVPGDGFEDVHWKATARRGRPITKVFQIEKTQEVYVVIDASRLSAREAVSSSTKESATRASTIETPGSKPEPANSESLLERFLTASLILGLAAERQGDLFGVVTFTDGVDRFLRARNGRAHYGACRDALYTLQPRLVAPDFDEIATFLRLRLRRRALLVFLTSLDDPVLAESFTRQVNLLSKQHLVLVNMLAPPGAAPLFSHDEVTSPDDLYRALGGHLQWRNLRELGKVLERRGVRFSVLESERLSAQLVSQYLDVKQRQML
jgi:uncharacterized protein (DUF58 family)